MEKGLIHGEKNEINGYWTYSEEAVVQAMLIREERALEYEVNTIRSLTTFPIDRQIDSLQNTVDSYAEQIAVLERKQKLLAMHIDVLKQFQKPMVPEITKGKLHLKAFYLDQLNGRNHKEAVEEAAQCIDSFPFVHITSTAELSTDEIHLIPGYEFNPARKAYRPLHDELYTDLPAADSVFMRTVLKDPLKLDQKVIQPMLALMQQENRKPEGEVKVGINAMEMSEEGMRYYCSIRIPLL